MFPHVDRAGTLIALDDRSELLLCVLFLLILLVGMVQPRLELHNDDLTIIACRWGELDFNHVQGYRRTVLWQGQDAGYTVNVRVAVPGGG